VTRRGGIRAGLLIAAAVYAAAVFAPSAASAAPAKPAASGITVAVDAPKRVQPLSKVQVSGAVSNPSPGETVKITVSASEREVLKDEISPGADGRFAMPLVVESCCEYVVTATAGAATASARFEVGVPKKLGKGKLTRLYNTLLQGLGFHTGTKGSKVTEGTRLATKAFRKTNGMRRSERYSPSIFRSLLQGRGAFPVQHPKDGRHVEVDISRQVMSLIEGDRPVHTFHVATGTGGTPTVRGSFRFYRKEPGYNAKRMYFSVYFIRGYATHGYSSVPNRRASHGCVRNPIQFSRFIYNWIDIGMPIHVYG
jgi:lipoprotein-anchoring transpeptidase ErfK/SrfK